MVAAKVGQVNGLFLSIFATNTILFIGYEDKMSCRSGPGAWDWADDADKADFLWPDGHWYSDFKRTLRSLCPLCTSWLL